MEEDVLLMSGARESVLTGLLYMHTSTTLLGTPKWGIQEDKSFIS